MSLLEFRVNESGAKSAFFLLESEWTEREDRSQRTQREESSPEETAQAERSD